MVSEAHGKNKLPRRKQRGIGNSFIGIEYAASGLVFNPKRINGHYWQGVKLVGGYLHNGFLRENSGKKSFPQVLSVVFLGREPVSAYYPGESDLEIRHAKTARHL